MFKRDIGLITRNLSFFMIRRCSRYTSRTTFGAAALLLSALLHLHQGLQVRHLLLAKDLLLLPALHFRIRASKVSFCTLRMHARLANASLSLPCSCWISHRRAFNWTMTVCKQRNGFHELNCSCHRNSCPEQIRKGQFDASVLGTLAPLTCCGCSAAMLRVLCTFTPLPSCLVATLAHSLCL